MDLDPLWSSEGLEYIHDGVETTRVEKAALVASNDSALNTLRVCMAVPEGEINCGKCEKCVRTMICLRAVGVDDFGSIFAAPIDHRRIFRLYGLDNKRRHVLPDLLHALEESQADPELTSVIRKIINTPPILGDIVGWWRILRFRLRGRGALAKLHKPK